MARVAGARVYARGFGVVTGAAGAVTAVACTACDAVGEPAEGPGEPDEGAGELDDGAGELDDGAGELDDGAGELDEGAGELDEGAGELDDGAGELDDGAGVMLVGPGPGVGRVTAGEVCWLLPGLLPLVEDGLLPGVPPGELVTTTVADACAVPICAVTWVVPGLTPVTRPEESTVATAGFPVVQAAPDRICGGALLPLLSWPVNGGWVVAAVPIRSVRGSMVSE